MKNESFILSSKRRMSGSAVCGISFLTGLSRKCLCRRKVYVWVNRCVTLNVCCFKITPCGGAGAFMLSLVRRFPWESTPTFKITALGALESTGTAGDSASIRNRAHERSSHSCVTDKRLGHANRSAEVAESLNGSTLKFHHSGDAEQPYPICKYPFEGPFL